MSIFKGIAIIIVGGNKRIITPENARPGELFEWEGLTYGVIEKNGLWWLDRNLGASRLPQTSWDSLAFGYLYQWGRGPDGHQLRTSLLTNQLSTTDNPGHGDFITTSAAPNNWRNPQNNNLWQGVNGVNNPCPPSWRVPTESEMLSELSSWGSSNIAGAFNSSLKFTLGGVRQLNGSIGSPGTAGYYHTSTISSAVCKHLYLVATFVSFGTASRATGMVVRAVKTIS